MTSINGIKVFIDSKRLVVFQTSDSDDGNRIKTKLFESKLEKNNLPQVLHELKEKNNINHINLLFSDDLVVTGIIQDESNTANDRESIGRLAKAKLALDLEKTIWDYTKIGDYYQIVCLPNDYASYIAPAFNEVGIKIESIEPVSVSLAKLMANQSEPTMLVYDDVERLVTVCWRGLVFDPTLFIPVELSNKAKKLKQNFTKEFNQEINQAVIIANFADPYLADLTALSLNTKVMIIDPFIGVETVQPVAETKTVEDIVIHSEKPTETVTLISDTEKPENFTNIWQEKANEVKVVNEPVKVEEKETITAITINRDDSIKPKRNLTWLAIILPLLITFITVTYLLINNKDEMYNPLLESSVSIKTASSSATITTDKEKLKTQVLNGSGKAGEATKVKGLLETAGFTVEAVGNATTSGAIKTEIKSTNALSESIKKDFQDSLSKLYDTQFTVAPVTGFDVVVTVGKSK